MKIYSAVIWCLAMLLWLPLPAQAQDGLFGLPEEEPAPSDELPALPVVEEQESMDTRLPSSVRGTGGMTMEFPQLPPSRLCTKRDIIGLWRLAMVFESPRGADLDDFGLYPYQYTLFNENDTYRSYKSERDEYTEPEILRTLQQSDSKVLEQFVVHESGVLYFYKDGVAVNSMACFVVANPVDPFAEGQMLLMPPPERANIRLVKAHQRVFSMPKPQKKKKNRNKRKNRRNRR